MVGLGSLLDGLGLSGGSVQLGLQPLLNLLQCFILALSAARYQLVKGRQQLRRFLVAAGGLCFQGLLKMLHAAGQGLQLPRRYGWCSEASPCRITRPFTQLPTDLRTDETLGDGRRCCGRCCLAASLDPKLVDQPGKIGGGIADFKLLHVQLLPDVVSKVAKLAEDLLRLGCSGAYFEPHFSLHRSQSCLEMALYRATQSGFFLDGGVPSLLQSALRLLPEALRRAEGLVSSLPFLLYHGVHAGAHLLASLDFHPDFMSD
mmetsp:Transcript_120300/g.285861  ORF Transcript_120300/g.285861 Transcript_120300/m.285861 type:complete len:260 (-) Transcript_120300:775-1554(-)